MEKESTGTLTDAIEPKNGIKVRALARTYFPIIMLVVLCAIFGALSPRFFTFNNAMIVLQQAAVLLTVSLGMTFVIIAGSIDLSVGSMVALTALTSALFARDMGVWAVLPAVGVGIVAGLINGLIFAKGKVPSFMVTLGTLVAYRGLVLYFTRGAPVEITQRDFLNTFAGRTEGIPHAAIIVLLIAIAVYIIFNNTVFGREVRAIGGGERVAILTGIKVNRVKILIFTMLGLLCGLAGTLQSARVYAATAQLGEGLEMDVIASVVVGGTPLTGGVGSIQGTVLGALVITILSNGMNMMGVDPYIQNIVKGIVLIAAVFVTIDRSKIGIIK
jgi:ribose/xylose/arabinose/galactoside ABC-type transport system permease subunit